MLVDLHTLIYMALAIAYFEAAVESIVDRKHRSAFREGIIACLYTSLAFFFLDPSLTRLHQTVMLSA
jgi:hypothetical protein